MALVFADRVKVRSNSIGTGAFTLDETVYAHQGFDAIGDGNETYYGIVDNNGNWEIGRGTYTAPDQLSRDTVQSSSNNDELVNFPAGGKNVFVTFPASLAGSISESVASDSFKTIAVAGQSSVVADSSTDTLTLVAGSNITLTTNATTDTITINSTASGGSSFDQDLNTTDQVTFDKVTTGVVEAGTVGSLDTLDLSAFNNIEVISVGGDVNLTGAGVSIVVGINDKTWDFGADGVLTFPDGSTQSTAGGGSSFDQNLNTTDDVTFGTLSATGVVAGVVGGIDDTPLNIETYAIDGESTVVNSWLFGTDGTITFPDATVQATAFLGGTPTELNDEENGNKLIIDTDGSLTLTDASGTLETPSGGGSNRGLVWDYGEANGGSNSHILEQSGEGDILEIRAFVTSEIQAPVRLTAGSSGNPKSLDWTPDGKLQRNADFLLSVAPGDSTESIWNFGTDGNTNIPGALVFPDGTTQTTAYTGAGVGEPLFVVVNVSGETAYSSDGESWTDAGVLSLNGYTPGGISRVAVGKSAIVYIGIDEANELENQLFYATEPGAEAALVNIPILSEEGEFTWIDVESGGNYIVAVGTYYDVGTDAVLPVWAYTSNGSTWTVGETDSFYQSEIGGEFISVDYNGNGWLFVNGAEAAGAFYLTDITATLGEDNYIDFVSNGLEAFPAISSVVWTGDRWILRDSDFTIVVGNGANALTATWTQIDMQPVAYEAAFMDGFGGFYEDAGGTINGTHWYMIASGNGQIIATSDGGDTFVTSIPSPYTGTIDAVSTDGDATITDFTSDATDTVWNGRFSESDHITISNASPVDYNGSYYLRERGTPDRIISNSSSANWTPGSYENVFLGGGEVIVNIIVDSNTPRGISDLIIVTTDGSKLFLGTEFTILGSVLGGTDGVDDADLIVDNLVGNDSEWVLYDSWDPDIGFAAANPIDWSLLDPFVSADFTLTRGTYIDATGFGLGKFLVGNDDEELFKSTDLQTWTKVNDLDNAYEYWEDISFNAEFGSTVAIVDRLTNSTASLILSATGDITFPNDVSLLNFNTESILFKSGDTFGIGGDQATFLQWQDYFPGQGPGKQSVVQTSDSGVTFYVSDPGDDTTYVWEFTTDGTTYLAKNSSSPVTYLQTPLNDETVGLYIGAGNGVTIAANDYSEGTSQWDFTPQGRLQFPGSGPAYTMGETEGGIEISSDTGIILTANVANSGQEKYFILYDDGKIRLPGATYSSPASPSQGILPIGQATAITVTNSPNPNWVTGNGVFINGMTFAIAVDGSGNATVTSISDGGSGHYVGETFGPIVGTTFGGTTPDDDMYFEVTAIETGSLTALDLTKQTQILTGIDAPGGYSLADGTEGQIMYFVPGSGTNNGIYVLIANARIYNDPNPVDDTNYMWVPFNGETLAPTTIAMAIFADGAWCLRGGTSD